MANRKPKTVKAQADKAAKLQKGIIDAQNPPEEKPDDFTKDDTEKQTELSLVESGIQDPPGKPAPDNWEERFKGLKATHDQTVFELRQQNAESASGLEKALNQISILTEQLDELRKSNTAPPAAEQAKVEVSDDEIEEYGQGLIDLIQKVSGGTTSKEVDLAKQVIDLQNRLDALTNTQKQVVETQVKDKRAVFWAELEDAVPDWKVINKDQKFKKWLATEMPGTGQERQFYLTQHFDNNDAGRVASLFNEFLGAKGPASTTQDDLEELVAPSGSDAGNVDTSHNANKHIWTRQEIADFYIDKRKGVYKKDKKSIEKGQRMERDIHAANNEGRIRG